MDNITHCKNWLGAKTNEVHFGVWLMNGSDGRFSVSKRQERLGIAGALQVNRGVGCATIHFSSKDKKAHADKTND
ncbi:MAG: hypothetical protein ABI457_02535 [Hyphomicrobium sp.]